MRLRSINFGSSGSRGPRVADGVEGGGGGREPGGGGGGGGAPIEVEGGGGGGGGCREEPPGGGGGGTIPLPGPFHPGGKFDMMSENRKGKGDEKVETGKRWR